MDGPCSGDDVPPPLLPHYRRLVGEAERDVPLVVLVHLQEYQHEAHELDEVARQADGERRGGEPHFGGICQGDEVLPVLEEVQGLPDLWEAIQWTYLSKNLSQYLFTLPSDVWNFETCLNL